MVIRRRLEIGIRRRTGCTVCKGSLDALCVHLAERKQEDISNVTRRGRAVSRYVHDKMDVLAAQRIQCIKSGSVCNYDGLSVISYKRTSGDSRGKKIAVSDSKRLLRSILPPGLSRQMQPTLCVDFKSDELSAMKFFLYNIAPEVDQRSSDFWNSMVPRAAHGCAAVRYSLVAISEVQSRRSQGLYNYNRAIQDLLASSKISIHDRLICLLLFVLIEMLQGSFKSVERLSFVARGLLSMLGRDARTDSERTIYAKIQSPIRRLQLRTSALCRAGPTQLQTYHEAWEAVEEIRDFTTAAGAYESLSGLAHEYEIRASIGVDKLINEQQYLAAMEAWYRRVVELELDLPNHNRLEITYRRMVFSLTKPSIPPKDAPKFEHNTYKKLIELGEAIAAVEDRPAIAFLGHYVMDMWYNAMYCKDPDLRRRALQIVENANCQISSFKSSWLARMAKRVIKIEEGENNIDELGSIILADRFLFLHLDWTSEPVFVRYQFKSRLLVEPLDMSEDAG